jgi:hypothetical protein
MLVLFITKTLTFHTVYNEPFSNENYLLFFLSSSFVTLYHNIKQQTRIRFSGEVTLYVMLYSVWSDILESISSYIQRQASERLCNIGSAYKLNLKSTQYHCLGWWWNVCVNIITSHWTWDQYWLGTACHQLLPVEN